MSYSRPDLAYQGFFSSGGTITATAGQIVQFVDGAGSPVDAGTIAIEFVTDAEINFDESTNYHAFLAGDKIDLQRVAFKSIRIKDNGSQIRFFGLYT